MIEVHKTYQSPGGAIYSLGVLGAAVHYVQTAVGFWGALIGVIKALFWPAFLVYRVCQVWGL
jgi:hypothetical protein